MIARSSCGFVLDPGLYFEPTMPHYPLQRAQLVILLQKHAGIMILSGNALRPPTNTEDAEDKATVRWHG